MDARQFTAFTMHILTEKKKLPNSLKVFVKLIESEDIEAQTDIIIATNTQNPVKSANLHANDDVQKP
ncbi:MAG: AIPR family protein [Ignavibacteriales bacterium]|nr:AIPR family protein [Ignavibacteriales bacterium]